MKAGVRVQVENRALPCMHLSLLTHLRTAGTFMPRADRVGPCLLRAGCHLQIALGGDQRRVSCHCGSRVSKGTSSRRRIDPEDLAKAADKGDGLG